MLRRCLSLFLLMAVTSGLAWNQGINTQASKNDWEEINFDFDSAVLVDGFPSLLRLAELLQANPGAKVRIEGFTDGLGTAAYNEKLGLSRANAVRDFLIKYGANAGQITASSKGESSPKVATQGDSYKRTDEARYMNRRVVLTVTDAQGNPLGAGGAGDAIRAIDAASIQKLQDCCDQILKRLDKLDDIAKMLKDLADQNAGLKRDLDQLKNEHAAMQRALDGVAGQGGRGGAAGPGGAATAGTSGPAGAAGSVTVPAGAAPLVNTGTPAAAASAADIARAVRDELNKQGGANGAGGAGSGGAKQAFQLMGLNVGADDRGKVTFNGRGRYFLPFGSTDQFGVQAQGDYYYIHGQKEAQIDFGLVDRVNKRAQIGLFGSFKTISLTGNQTSGTLGQASFVADYFFGRGKVGLFATKGFKDNALINRANGIGPNGELQRNIILERYLKVVDQVGVQSSISLIGNTYAEGNIGYLRSSASSNRVGGSLKFVLPMSDKFAFTVEGGVNETLLPFRGGQQGRAAVGVQLGNFLRPKQFLAAGHAIPMEIPRVRYETLTKRVRTGNDPPVADAGPDQLNAPVGTVVLDGSNSYDPDGDPLTYQWVLEQGPAVSINNQTSAKASFVAGVGQFYSFRLTVKDNQGGQSSARVRISTQSQNRAQVLFFTSDPRTINGGQQSTLSWRVLNADTVTISGIGTVEASGSRPVSPTTTTTYVLTAKNQINEDTATTTVVVSGAKFQFCYATPPVVAPGQAATLNWGTNGATNVSITPGIGAVAPTGSIAVTPTTDTTYTLTASGGGQNDTCTIAVRVGGPNSGAPVIGRFSADPSSIDAGQNSTLTWSVTGADSVSISTLGNVTASGSRTVSPSATTTYILTATNGAGTSTAQATVAVSNVTPLQILSFTASPAVFKNPGDKVDLTCRTQGASRVAIGIASGFEPDFSLPVFPTVETTYTCVATNSRGQTVTRSLVVKQETPTTPPGGGQPPVIVSSSDNIKTLSRLVYPDASASFSPSGNGPLTFRWTSDDPVAISDANTAKPTIFLSLPRSIYTILLTVTDKNGNTTTKSFRIEYGA